MYTVVVADDEPITRMDIAGMLAELGCRVVGEASDGFDAVELCRRERPDVVLMDVKMPVFDGLSAAETIVREELAQCVVLLTAYNDRESIQRAKRAGVSGYLVKPVEQRLLLPAVEIALAQSERLRRSREETAQSRRQLEESRLIRQAQTVLSRRDGISEGEAYRLLRRMSMDKRVSMAALAQAVLDQERRRDDVAAVKALLARERGMSEEAAFQKITELAAELKCSREEAARRLRQRMEGL